LFTFLYTRNINLNNESCKVAKSLGKLFANTLPHALKRFKYLANKMKSPSDTSSSTQPAVASIQDQIDNYLYELQQPPDENNASGVFSKGAIVPWPPFGRAVKFFYVKFLPGGGVTTLQMGVFTLAAVLKTTNY
jgi:hypothetical protein